MTKAEPATEGGLLPLVRLALSRAGATMHRNNQGIAYYGAKRDQVVKYGLGVGTSDLIGWTPVVVTPDMVGKTVAVYTAVEVKSPSGGHEREEQRGYIKLVLESGGFAGFCRSVNEALDIIKR